MTTISSKELDQNAGSAMCASNKGPVFITDRGKPSHVLLTIDEYERLTKQKESVIDLLAMPESADIEFESQKTKLLLKQAEFD